MTGADRPPAHSPVLAGHRERWAGLLGALMTPAQFRFLGLSTIADSDGTIAAQLGESDEGIAVAEVALVPPLDCLSGVGARRAIQCLCPYAVAVANLLPGPSTPQRRQPRGALGTARTWTARARQSSRVSGRRRVGLPRSQRDRADNSD